MSQAIEYIGRSLENTKDEIDPNILQRIKALFEFRLRSLEDTSNQRSDEEVLEFQPFGWWFVSSKFEGSWALEMLSVVLDLTSGKIEPDHLVIEKLAELSETGYLKTCLQNLEKMILGDQEGWEIYGWHKEARKILAVALQQNDGDVASVALRVINYLGRQGYHEFRDLLILLGSTKFFRQSEFT